MPLNLGIGLGMGRGGAGVGYEAEALTLFAAMSVQPDSTRKALINTLIKALKDASIWSSLDLLYMTAAHDSQAALLNWKNPATFVLSPVASPTFTIDRGYDFNGVDQYLNPAWVPNTDAVNYTLNSASMFTWLLDNVAGDGYAMATNTGSIAGLIPRRSSGNTVLAAINTGTTTGTGVGSTMTDSTGLTIADRSGAALTTVNKNGVDFGTHTVASSGVPTGTPFFGARNQSGVANSFDTRAGAAYGFGASLGSTKSLALYNAMLAYMQGVGAA